MLKKLLFMTVLFTFTQAEAKIGQEAEMDGRSNVASVSRLFSQDVEPREKAIPFVPPALASDVSKMQAIIDSFKETLAINQQEYQPPCRNWQYITKCVPEKVCENVCVGAAAAGGYYGGVAGGVAAAVASNNCQLICKVVDRCVTVQACVGR